MSKNVLITGALSYSGRYIAQALSEEGYHVSSLEGERSMQNPNPHHYPVIPFNWAQPERMEEACAGAQLLVNTYWIRPTEGEDAGVLAEERCRMLIELARHLKLERVVHISVLNADPRSPLEYFRRKGLIEAELKLSQIPHTVLRPAMLFGDSALESVLINNWAWCLRNTPVAGLLGDGEAQLHPIHVRDLAQLALKGLESAAPQECINAVGEECLSLRECVTCLLEAMQLRRIILPMPRMLAQHAAKLLTRITGGKPLLVEEEIDALLAGYLALPGEGIAGSRSFKSWIQRHAEGLGRELI